jgi:hypothetical protein
MHQSQRKLRKSNSIPFAVDVTELMFTILGKFTAWKFDLFINQCINIICKTAIAVYVKIKELLYALEICTEA